MGAILPTFIDPSAATAELQSLSAGLDQTNQAVLGCTSLDGATAQAWGTFYTTAHEYTTTEPGWLSPSAAAVYQQAQSYARQLYAWQKELQTAGCTLNFPVIDPDANPQVDQFLNALKYGAWIIGGIAAAYMIHAFAELIPERQQAPKSPPRKK